MAAYTLPEGFSDFDMFAFGSALLVGGLLGFFLNAISILAYISVKEMRTPSNFLVFNLAVADIMLNTTGLIAAFASLSYSFLATIAWDRYHQYVTKAVLEHGLDFFYRYLGDGHLLGGRPTDWDYMTYMGALTVFYLIFPAYVMKSNYDAIHAYFKKIHKHRWNTSVPLRVLLFCWGPYEIMCIYACFANTKLVSPKLRMLLPVLAKMNPIFNAWLYSFGNEFYRGGVWQFLTGQKFTEPVVVKLKGR
ncbi:unnamed protein product [Coregonus sp. 'balchen']|nr:unnamed protein product [Coregonus sp. 'balchen']